MKLPCSCAFCGVVPLLFCFLLQLLPLTLCMLRCAVPGLHDAVAPEQDVEGCGNVLQLRLPSLLLSSFHSKACHNHVAPGLQSTAVDAIQLFD